MGLDMYALSVPATEFSEEQTDVVLVAAVTSDLYYWRKFNALHGWMERLYIKKGGKDEFNCRTVRLDSADLDELENAVKAGMLTPTAGFFFGEQEVHPDDLASLEKFIPVAREAIAKVVFYDSWW